MRIGLFAPQFKRLTAEPGRLVGVDGRGRRLLLPRYSWVIGGALSIVEKSDGLKRVQRSLRWAISEAKHPERPARPIPPAPERNTRPVPRP